jgi:methyl-accepting chemotaxis protein
MKYSRKSFVAVVMIVTAVLGWLISLAGLVGIWSNYSRINNSVENFVNLANRSLDTSTQLLDVTDNTIKTTGQTVTQIQTSLLDVSTTFGNTSPLFNSAANMVGQDFSKMAADTHVALVSLAGTAKVIDDTLRFISSVPFIGQPYNPSVPLDASVNNLAASIEKLPANLNDIQGWLTGTGKDLTTLKEDTAQLSKSIEKITPQLSAASQVITQYRKLVQDLRTELTGLSTRLSQILIMAALSLTVFLVWLALAQVGPFVQGLERLQSSPNKNNDVMPENFADQDDILETIENETEEDAPA